jgi:sn-glycerol 3-phosphate transport system substrate-binding protein
MYSKIKNLSALAVLTLAASSAAAPVQISYWAGHGSGALHKAVLAEVALFNRTHPAIHVTFRAIGASKRGLAAFEAGQAPNLAMVSSYVVPQLAQAGAILNLRPFVHGADGLTPAQIAQRYYPAVWRDMHTSSGQLYQMPLEKKALMVVYYNASLFKRAGIHHLPASWSQVSADLAKISALGHQIHGAAWTPALRQFFDIVRADGGRVFAPGHPRRRFDLVNAGARQALTMLRGWVKSGEVILTSGYQYQLDFGTGNVGMLFDASAGYTYDKGSVGGKFYMGGLPDPVGSSGFSSQEINGASLVLFGTGSLAQKQAAWTFMKWLSSPKVNAYWNAHTNYLPLGPAVYQLMRPFYRAHPAWAASFSDPAQWWYKPRTANYVAARNALQAILLEALRGQIGVGAALRQMNQTGNAYLSGKLRG